jgi:hypothetical protein
MPYVDVVATLTRLGAGRLGVFRVRDATANGISAHQIRALATGGVIAKELPGVYRLTAVRPSLEQRLHAALAWAGPTSSRGWSRPGRRSSSQKRCGRAATGSRCTTRAPAATS